jgi:N-acetylneuraminate synthase
MRYIDYKQYIEFWFNEYNQIEQWAQELGLEWGVSVWDVESSRFMEQFPADFIKIPSAHITNHTLLREVKWAHKDKVIMMSTGMSEMIEVEEAIRILQPDVVYHCNSQYPCPVNEINLTAMFTLADLQWDLEVYYDVGYSGHETGLATTIAAVALGAKYIERHITLDRSSWGTDQSASVEPVGMRRLVRDIRSVEKAMGNGMIECTNGEKPIRRKLRGY